MAPPDPPLRMGSPDPRGRIRRVVHPDEDGRWIDPVPSRLRGPTSSLADHRPCGAPQGRVGEVVYLFDLM